MNAQNLVGLDLAVVVMVAKTNDIGDLQPLMPRVREVFEKTTPGNVLKIT